MHLNLDDLEAASADLVHTGWGYNDEDVTFYGHPHARLELVIHEAAHAASLGFALDTETPAQVGAAIQKMDGNKPAYTGHHLLSALREEASAWAVEWEVIQRLGMSFEWGDVEEGAAVQGVEAGMVEKYVGTQRTRELATEVLGWLADLLEEAEDEA